MYIVAIAWLYVALMMAITERSITSGVMTFVFYGLAPCALVWWLFGGAARKAARAKARSVPDEVMHQPNGADAKADQDKLGD